MSQRRVADGRPDWHHDVWFMYAPLWALTALMTWPPDASLGLLALIGFGLPLLAGLGLWALGRSFRGAPA